MNGSVAQRRLRKGWEGKFAAGKATGINPE